MIQLVCGQTVTIKLQALGASQRNPDSPQLQNNNCTCSDLAPSAAAGQWEAGAEGSSLGHVWQGTICRESGDKHLAAQSNRL